MKMLESELFAETTKRAVIAPRENSAPMLTNRSLAPVRASSIAPGLRELRLWELPEGAVGRCEMQAGDRVTLTGVEGQCWVTQQGDRHDYLLFPGKTLTFRGPGMLVFEAVSDDATLAVS